MLSEPLPAGHFVLSATASWTSFPATAADYYRCQIAVGDTVIASTATYLGTNPGDPGDGFIDTSGLAGGATVPAGGATAVLQCSHDNTATDLAVVEWAQLWIYKATSLGTGGSDTYADMVVPHSDSTTLGTAADTEVRVMSAVLSSGAFVVSANGDVVDYDASDYVRCQLVDNDDGTDTTIATSASIVGNYASDGGAGQAQVVAGLALTGSVTVAPNTKNVVVLECDHDRDNGAAPYFDEHGDLWVHATDSLSTTGPATDEVVQSSSGNIAISSSQYTPIVTATVAQKTSYVLQASGDVVNFGPEDSVSCEAGLAYGFEDESVGSGCTTLVSNVDFVGAIPAKDDKYSTSLGFQCIQQANNQSGSATAYYDYSKALWVHQTTSLDIIGVS